MRGPSESNGELIGGTLVPVDCPSKLRLELLLDENTERNFSLNHFFGDRSLFGGVDMTVIDETESTSHVTLEQSQGLRGPSVANTTPLFFWQNNMYNLKSQRSNLLNNLFE